MKAKLILLMLLLPVLVQAQGIKNATFGNAADTSSAVVIDKKDVFTGLIVPDDINSDSLRFLVSDDGTTYYNLYRPGQAAAVNAHVDSTNIYYLVVADTSTAYYTVLPSELFRGFRRLKIVLDATVSSAADDVIKVMHRRER